MTVAELIKDVRGHDPFFSRTRLPETLLAHGLTSIERRLVQRANEFDDAYLNAAHPITLPLADFDAGGAIDPSGGWMAIRGADLVNSEERLPLPLINFGGRHEPHRLPAAYVSASRLFLLGHATRYLEFTSIDVWYLPLPPTLTVSSTLLLTDEARGAATAALALFARRRVPESTQPLGAFEAESRQAEEDWIRMISMRRIATSGVVRDVRGT
jgi:hypothetical protein